MKYIVVDMLFDDIKEKKGKVPELSEIDHNDYFICNEVIKNDGEADLNYFCFAILTKDEAGVAWIGCTWHLVHAEIFLKALIEDLKNDPICRVLTCDNKKVIHYCKEHADRE